MKVLFLHVDYIKFKPLRKALRSMEALSEKDKEEKEMKNCLVAMTAVEKTDSSVEKIVSEFVKNISEVAKSVKTENIVLYPYAHLSSNLSSPEIAVKVLEKTEKKLKKEKFKVKKAPFGYYKEFELKVKGHPLAELSREIVVEKGLGETKEEVRTYDFKQLLGEISKSKLDTSKLKPNDHRIIGKQMDLYSFNDVAPGMVFWHNNGLIIKDALSNFWKEKHRRAGWREISTPQVLDDRIWKISGHWEKYKDNIFLTKYEKRDFAVKPMSCPGGILIFKNSPKSYKDLPLRVGELGIVHRQELSGVLGGLFRVIQFVQDDGHVFCTEEQMEEEILKIFDMTTLFYDKFNLPYRVELSTRPKKRIGSNQMWDKSEKTLENALKKRKIKYKLNKGDGAFYGPKIDFHVKDSLGRDWQCGTIQLDFSMPERFNIEYNDKDNRRKRPVMIHRAIYGSLERFIGILIEHTNGRLPLWLAPVQARVLSFTDRNKKYSEKILKKLEKEIPELRIDSNFSSTTISSKVKDAEIMRIPYLIVIGDREEKENKLAVRVKGNKKIKHFEFEKFVKKLKEEIEEKN